MTDERAIRALVRKVVYRTLGGQAPGSARSRGLVTVDDLESVPTGGELLVRPGALISPLARQVASERKIRFAEQDQGSGGRRAQTGPVQTGRADSGEKTVAIAADHGGYGLKEILKRHVGELGFGVIDCGTSGEQAVDYPDFALAAAQLVAQGRAWRGIVVDGAGVGSCMAANKVPGVRAAMCYDEATAVNSRAHNDANLLTLGAGLIGPQLSKQIVKIWLETPAEGGRHTRRVSKIMDIERRFLKRTEGGRS